MYLQSHLNTTEIFNQNHSLTKSTNLDCGDNILQFLAFDGKLSKSMELHTQRLSNDKQHRLKDWLQVKKSQF